MQKQQGVSLSGLIVVIFITIVVLLLGFKLFKPYVEYFAIQKIFRTMATKPEVRNGTRRDAMQSWASFATIEGVSSLSGDEIEINKEGGIKGAQGRFMLDYWGLAFKQAAWSMLAKLGEEGAKPPPGRKWKVAVCGPHPPAKFALGDDFEPTWDPKGADFALMIGEFYCARLDAPLLAEIDREGLIFARAYDLRGKTIEQLFTRPPVTAN